MNDGLRLRGQIRAVVFEGDLSQQEALAFLDGGSIANPVVSDQTWTNLVTNVGRQQMTKLAVAESTPTIRYMALSTSTPALLLTDTALPNEINRSALVIFGSFASYSQRYVAYFPTALFGSTGLAGEGLFDTASTGGLMWAETAITVSKTTTQALTIDHRILASS